MPEVLSTFTSGAAARVAEADPALQFAVVSATALAQARRHPERIRTVLRLDRAQTAMLDGGVLDHLRADLDRGVECGRFSVTVDHAVLDVVAGSLLLAVHRVVERDAGGDYATGVVAQLLRSLGVTGHESARIAADAVRLVGPATTIDR